VSDIFCRILTKIGIFRQNFVRIPSISFHSDPSSGSRSVWTDGWTGTNDEVHSCFLSVALRKPATSYTATVCVTYTLPVTWWRKRIISDTWLFKRSNMMGCIKLNCHDSSYPTDSGAAAQRLIKWTWPVMGRPDFTCTAFDSSAAVRADKRYRCQLYLWSKMVMLIIIIIIIINFNLVVTRWQWLFYMYTKY